MTDDGVPIYDFPNNFGFLIVLEGRPGTNGRTLDQCGTMGTFACANGRAAPQIIASRTLGNGSPAVCDVGPLGQAPIGGVPAVPSLSFAQSAATDNAIADLGCRLDVHPSSNVACTFDELGNFKFVRDRMGDPVKSTIQYCSVPVFGSEIALPSGITRLKAQIQDVNGVTGSVVEIAISVP